jgi:hypothetical protein
MFVQMPALLASADSGVSSAGLITTEHLKH